MLMIFLANRDMDFRHIPDSALLYEFRAYHATVGRRVADSQFCARWDFAWIYSSIVHTAGLRYGAKISE